MCFEIEIALVDWERDISAEHIDLDTDSRFVDSVKKFCALRSKRTILDDHDIASMEARLNFGSGDDAVFVRDAHQRVDRESDWCAVSDEIDHAENCAQQIPLLLSNDK